LASNRKKSGFKVKQKSALPVTAPQDCFPIDKLLTVRNLELGAAKTQPRAGDWDALERSCCADNVPRRDQDLSDEEREMDRLRSQRLSLILKALGRQSQKFEELVIRWRYITEDHKKLPDALQE
jgi:hypothetical protein